MWLKQTQLDACIKVMKDMADNVTDVSGMKIMHPTQKFTDRQWEAVICGLFASHSPFASGVLPENTFQVYPN